MIAVSSGVILNLELSTKISSPHSSSRDSVLLIYVLPHHPCLTSITCVTHFALTFVTENILSSLVLCLDLQMDRYELSKCLLNKYTW